MNKKNYLVLLIIICTVSGFIIYLINADKEVIYKGMYKNQKVIVKSITKAGFSTNTIYYSIKLGDLKSINIDYSSTDNRGVPYHDSVFEPIKPVYIDTNFTYQNEITYDSLEDFSILYIAKSVVNEKQYYTYEDFFKNKWPEIQKILKSNKIGFAPHIVGVVYGNREDFIKSFKGPFENKIFDLTISPDGEIILNTTGNTAGMQNSGLSNKIQMPGRFIIKKLNEASYAPNYENFKDTEGKTIYDYFEIKLK